MSVRSAIARWHVGQLSIVVGTAVVVIALSILAGVEGWRQAEWDRQIAYLPIPYSPAPAGLTPESLATYNASERVTRAKREADRDSKIPEAEEKARSRRGRIIVLCFLGIPGITLVTAMWAAWTWLGARGTRSPS